MPFEHNTDNDRNVNMIEVTHRAKLLFKDFFKNREIKPVRIFVKLGGCGIRSFGVGLEKKKPTDEVIKINQFTLIVDKKFLDLVKPIKIDADTISFRISGNGIQPNSGCGTCGYLCGFNGSGRCIGDCLKCRLPCSRGKRIKAENMKRTGSRSE